MTEMNRETQAVARWLRRSGHAPLVVADFRPANRLEQIVEAQVCKMPAGLLADLVCLALDRVNWDLAVESFVKEENGGS